EMVVEIALRLQNVVSPRKHVSDCLFGSRLASRSGNSNQWFTPPAADRSGKRLQRMKSVWYRQQSRFSSITGEVVLLHDCARNAFFTRSLEEIMPIQPFAFYGKE